MRAERLHGTIRTIAAKYRIAYDGEQPFYYPHLLTIEARKHWWSPFRHFFLFRADVLEPGTPPNAEGGRPNIWYSLDGRRADVAFHDLHNDDLTMMYMTMLGREQDRVQAPSRQMTMHSENMRVSL